MGSPLNAGNICSFAADEYVFETRIDSAIRRALLCVLGNTMCVGGRVRFCLLGFVGQECPTHTALRTRGPFDYAQGRPTHTACGSHPRNTTSMTGGDALAPQRITPLALPGREPRFAQIEFAFQLAK